MGNSDSKLSFRKAVIQLTTKTQPVDVNDDAFWDQFWAENVATIQDVFSLVPAAEIRALREENPSNLATLCFKAVGKLEHAAHNGAQTQKEQEIVMNCVRILTRILPYIFEDPEWRGFFWSTVPGSRNGSSRTQAMPDDDDDEDGEARPLAQTLINAISDLLFCPDFTVAYHKSSGPETHEDPQSIDSCEYIWEAGVGFAHSQPQLPQHDQNRTELLKLLLTCFSDAMYLPPVADAHSEPNKWIAYFTSADNRHALPLFTSLINVVCSYDPVGYGVPYNHLLFTDHREPLVEIALQMLCVTLDHLDVESTEELTGFEPGVADNLFVNYLSRIHRDEDFALILKGITRLLTNPLVQTYLPGSCKRVHFYQELLVLFWKMCDANKKFLLHVLKSSDVLDILVPILYHLNDSRADQSRLGLMHIAVFILLLLSGERNFGVRLNKPYTIRVPMDIPVFTGNHADLLIIVFHKIVTTGHSRLQPLFDCLLTIIVNVSPYVKSLSMVASTKLLHLLEAFSTPWFLYSNSTNHHLVFFLLEVFNNIVQYQFDGNSNLVYTIIRKRNIFHALANLPVDYNSIAKALAKKSKRLNAPSGRSRADSTFSTAAPPVPVSEAASPVGEQTQEGAFPAQEAPPGTLKTTLAATPAVSAMTEKTHAHKQNQLGLPEDQAVSEAIGEEEEEENGEKEEEPSRPQRAVDVSSKGAGSVVANGSNSPPPSAEDAEVARAMSGNGSGDVNQSEVGNRQGVSDEDEGDEASSRLKFNQRKMNRANSSASSVISAASSVSAVWTPTPDWVSSWKQKLPLQTIMRMLQVLVPQVEKICIDKGLTDESEILKFLQHGTLVGLLPVPHPILIRKYQPNSGTTMWFRTYMWGVIYLRNMDPGIWYDTDVKLFEIQRV